MQETPKAVAEACQKATEVVEILSESPASKQVSSRAPSPLKNSKFRVQTPQKKPIEISLTPSALDQLKPPQEKPHSPPSHPKSPEKTKPAIGAKKTPTPRKAQVSPGAKPRSALKQVQPVDGARAVHKASPPAKPLSTDKKDEPLPIAEVASSLAQMEGEIRKRESLIDTELNHIVSKKL